MDPHSQTEPRMTMAFPSASPRWVIVLVVAPVLAMLLDAWQPLPLAGALWIDLAALAIVVPGVVRDRRARADLWRTPLDGRILAILGVSLVQVLAPATSGLGAIWLRQMLTCGALYFGLVAAFRRSSRALEAAWAAFAAAAVLLAGHALLAATSGLGALAREAASADPRWAAQQGLARALVVATVLTVARAAERGAGPGWRLAALLGATGTALHVFASGLGLTAIALARLDDPLYFSSSCVLLLLLFEITRRAWALRRAREGEGRRWLFTTLGFAALAFMTLFGATLGGEGVRVLAAMAAAMVVAAGEKPAAAPPARIHEPAVALPRAA